MTNPRLFSTLRALCTNGQKKSDWKYKTNYFRENLDRETYGDVIKVKKDEATKVKSSTKEGADSSLNHWLSDMNNKSVQAKTKGKKPTSSKTDPEQIKNASKPKETNEIKHQLLNVERASLDQSKVPENVLQIRRENKRKVPSVSKVLRDSMSMEQRLILEMWEAKMRKKLGDEGFDLYVKANFKRGHVLHSHIEHTLLGQEPKETEDEVSLNHIKSLSEVIAGFSSPVAIESHVIHPELDYHGILDCVALYEQNFVLIDWKTSERKKRTLKSTYDNPIQLAAYAGALNHDSRYDFAVKNAMLVIVYNDGTQAQALSMDEKMLEFYWKEWLKRLQIYNSIHKR